MGCVFILKVNLSACFNELTFVSMFSCKKLCSVDEYEYICRPNIRENIYIMNVN